MAGKARSQSLPPEASLPGKDPIVQVQVPVRFERLCRRGNRKPLSRCCTPSPCIPRSYHVCRLQNIQLDHFSIAVNHENSPSVSRVTQKPGHSGDLLSTESP